MSGHGSCDSCGYSGPEVELDPASGILSCPYPASHLADVLSEHPSRPDWDTYFLGFAKQAATRATCDRKHVGAIVVVNHRIVSTGYNGSPKGMPHCDDVGHDMKEIDGRASCVRTLHAESNALDDAGRLSDGGTIYVTVTPCFRCAQRIVQHGIKRVVYGEHYASQMTSLVEDLFLAAGIEMIYAGEQP